MKKLITCFLVCLLASSLCLTVFVSAEKNIADTISLPAALVQGHSYDLQVADTVLTVNGQVCDGSFTAEGAETVLSYADAKGNAIADFTLPVVDTKGASDHCAYFYADSGVTKAENENDVALSFSKDGQAAFISKLNAEDLAMYLSFPEGKTNYEKLHLTLTDATNATVKLTFTVDMAEKTVTQGKQVAELEKLGDSLQLRFKGAARKLMLGNDKTLFACNTDDSGEDLAGFPGGVYLTLAVEGVSGASTVGFNRVGNQPLGHKDSDAADAVEPTVQLTSVLPSTLKMGDTFRLPSYRVYDVLSTVTESKIVVEAPDGTQYTEDFTVSQYGKYKLTVIAKDSSGNQMKANKTVFVNDDIAPELTVSSMENTTYKVGEAVKIPGYSVTDNLDTYSVDVILFMPNGEIRMLTHDEKGEMTYCLTDTSMYPASFISDNNSFKAEQAGTHTIRYVAYDDQYNRVVQNVTFTVE